MSCLENAVLIIQMIVVTIPDPIRTLSAIFCDLFRYDDLNRMAGEAAHITLMTIEKTVECLAMLIGPFEARNVPP